MSDSIHLVTRPVWSATRLKSFLTCPRQYRYSYVDGIPAVPTSPLVLGRTLHETLCFAHERQMETRYFPPLGEVLSYFDQAWRRALEEERPLFRPGALTPEAHLTLGHQMLRAFVASPGNQKPPLAVELAFEVEAGGYNLCGVIDRVDEGERGLVIVDFKSGARKPSPADLQSELQFTLYAFAAQRVLGQKVERVVHLHLRDGSYLTTQRDESDFEWLFDQLLPHVAGAVERQEFTPRAGYWCNWCDFRELCQAENRARHLQNVNGHHSEEEEVTWPTPSI